MVVPNIKFSLNRINGEIDYHTLLMREFLKDSFENCKKYADGMESKDNPHPVKFSWNSMGCFRYVLKISESYDMSEPWLFETDKTEYEVYNLKIGTNYYWCIDVIENNEIIYTSATESFSTVDIPPRNLMIEGVVCNARDIGGWRTLDGRRIKQGMIFRSSTFDDYDPVSGKMRDFVDAEGKKRLKLLGIKTEIDFRMDNSQDENYPPGGKNTSIIGDGVKYYHCPIETGPENYLKSIESFRKIFKLLSDKSKYPITYHCAVGADRTGAITYLINGLLGVDKETLLKEYMLTNFSRQYKYRAPINEGYVETIDNYKGETLQEKIYNYLNEKMKIPSEDLDFIIDFLVE